MKVIDSSGEILEVISVHEDFMECRTIDGCVVTRYLFEVAFL